MLYECQSTELSSEHEIHTRNDSAINLSVVLSDVVDELDDCNINILVDTLDASQISALRSQLLIINDRCLFRAVAS
jgi:hypothetical protein